MTKYIVRRSSTWDYEQPVEEAVPCEIHKYESIAASASESVKERFRYLLDVEREDEKGLCGYYKKPTKAWMCDIPDLHKFVEKYGKIILFKPSNKEGLWEVEIYDDYRE